jgi:hypothetical protein
MDVSQRLLAVALAALAGLAPLGSAGRPASDATAVITGSGGRYVLSVTNTGALPIRCMRFRPALGVQILWTNGYSLVRNTIGAAGPSPGQTSRTRLRTKQPYPPRAGGELTLNNPSFSRSCFFPGRRIRVTGPARR